MRASLLVLSCMAWAGHARRVHTNGADSTPSESKQNSQKSLAHLLSTLNPEAGFQVNGAMQGRGSTLHPGSPTRSGDAKLEAAPWDTLPGGVYPKPEPGSMSAALPFSKRPERLDALDLAGDVGFDPMGFADHKLGPFDTPAAHLGWMREAEVKHGRVCMLAVIGWILVDLGVRAPGVPPELKDATLTSFKAHDVAVGDSRMLLLLMACLVFEIAGVAGIQATLAGKREPGDFALMGGFKGCSPEQLRALKQAEIKHGRLAMMAFSGLQTACAISGGNLGFPYVR